jgi:hypothetical protein
MRRSAENVANGGIVRSHGKIESYCRGIAHFGGIGTTDAFYYPAQLPDGERNVTTALLQCDN